jgi:omega-amidase
VPNDVYNNDVSLKYAQDMWIAMNRTRAFDNLVYIVSCNQTKEANGNVSCIGNSLIISPTTAILANAKDEQTASYADIDLEIVKYYKSIYPIAEIE